MTTTPKPSRADQVRQRRATTQRSQPAAPRTNTAARQSYRPESVYLPVEPRPASRQSSARFTSTAQGSVLGRTLRSVQGTPAGRVSRQAGRNHSDYSFSLGRADVRAPALSIPQLGPRWISLVLSGLLTFLLITMWTASTFTVTGADVRGNQRLTVTDINGMLGMVGQPIFKAIPAKIEANLRTAFPDLASVRVGVGFPNHITVTVDERIPVLAWYQNQSVTWIDANGVAFMPRGQVKGLIQVASNGTPPKIQPDPSLPLFAQAFIEPQMVKAMIALSPYIPAGAPMIYDPQYGMGWQDPRGWSVYFGQNTQDIPMKLVVYQAIVDTFTKNGTQPTMVDMEYLDAPFYK